MSFPALARRVGVVLLLVALPISATISYPAPVFVNVGSQPTYIVVADFNGDCNPDFATVNVGSTDLSIGFGDGSGGFPTIGTVTGFTSPQFIAVGDINEDGHPDLVVGNRMNFGDPTNTLKILLNGGTGTFTAVTPALSLDGMPQGIAVGDFDQDGHLDVMVGMANGTNNLSLFLGDGTGHFGAASHPTLTLGGGGQVNDIVAGDWNGDGHLDLVIATFYQVLWITGNGDGTFNTQTSYTFPNTQGEGGAVAITAADIDHDGDLDVATAGGNVIAGASVFINNGSGVFTAHQMSMPQAPANPISVRLADLDGDGNIDIVTADQSGCTPWGSNLAARPGNGNGTFGAAVPISIGYGPTCLNSHWQPAGLGIVDLNCDGKMDIISANSATGFVSVLLSTGGVPDATPPVVTAPANVTVSIGTSATTCDTHVTDAQLGTATATDNCATCVSIVRSGVPAGNMFPVGATPVTYTANDGHGNSGTAVQTVTVIDNTSPVVTAPPNVNGSCSGNINPGTATASDNCPGVTVSGVRSDAQPLGATYPVGTTTITWTALDASGNSASAPQTVTVVPSAIVIGGGIATPAVLWPPNHNMISVAIDYTSSGGCGSVACSITGVASNEPADGLGDGDRSPDWQIVDTHHVVLRSERSGTGNGRTYTITISCTDGNTTTTKNVTVEVPKSKK